MLTKRQTSNIIRRTKQIIDSYFLEVEYIPLQALHERVLDACAEYYPRRNEFYKIVKDNFEVVKRDSLLCVHAHYKPTDQEAIPVMWIKNIIRSDTREKLTPAEMYILYLEEAEKIGARTKSKTFLFRVLEQNHIKY